jgi:hypothetical protein
VVAALGGARGGVGVVAWPRKLAGTWLDGGGHGARRRSEKGVAGDPAREARATSLYSRRRASSGPTGGRPWYIGRARPNDTGRTAGRGAAVRRRGARGALGMHAAWRRGGLEARVLGRREGGRGRRGDGARRERVLGNILL